MAEGVKRLAKDTAVYGLSTILGKVLNWLLVPMYVRVLENPGEYGIVTNLYAWTALLQVILTYGMETGFFRFVGQEGKTPERVYSTTLVSVGTTTSLFFLLGFLFLQPISDLMDYGSMPEYVAMLIALVGLDAFLSIPFAWLRYRRRSLRFGMLKLTKILLAIGLNFFFLLLCPWIYKHYPESISWFYFPHYGVGYIFISDLISSVVALLLFIPELTGFRYVFDLSLLRKMLCYSFPILILGIAGILNQTIDKIIFPFLFEDREYADTQLGIYGACFKIAMIMIMFIQAFRYAYEPFIFARNKNEDSKKTYAEAMKYFIIFALFIFLGVMFYLDIIKYLVGPKYYAGLSVVPIVMLGEMFFGIYFNLSLWYKLTDETKWGAYFSIFGCVVTVCIILFFAPVYGFMACAWASFVCNLLMMLLSYFIGQKKFPIRYDLKTAFVYMLLASVLYAAAMIPDIANEWLRLLYRSVFLGIFVVFTVKRDLPLREIPFLNRLIK